MLAHRLNAEAVPRELSREDGSPQPTRQRKKGLISTKSTAAMVEGSGPGASMQRSASMLTGSFRPSMESADDPLRHVNRRGDGRRAGMGMPVSSAADVRKSSSVGEGYELVPGGAGAGGGPVLLGEDFDLGHNVTHVLEADSTDDESVEGDAVNGKSMGTDGNDDVLKEEDEPPPPQRRKTLAATERKQKLSKEVSSDCPVFPIRHCPILFDIPRSCSPCPNSWDLTPTPQPIAIDRPMCVLCRSAQRRRHNSWRICGKSGLGTRPNRRQRHHRPPRPRHDGAG